MVAKKNHENSCSYIENISYRAHFIPWFVDKQGVSFAHYLVSWLCFILYI